jgi:taurine dioxygenase
VSGVDLRRPTPELLAEMHRALLEWKVLFFEDQQLTAEQHLELALHWGPVQRLPFQPANEHGVTLLTRGSKSAGNENIWHIDTPFFDPVPLGSILRAVEVPPVGGDTLWADMAAAFEGLDDATRSHLSGLTAIHDWDNFRRGLRNQGMSEEKIAELNAEFPPAEHPVVRTHPVSGQKILYVNANFTVGIKGMS